MRTTHTLAAAVAAFALSAAPAVPASAAQAIPSVRCDHPEVTSTPIADVRYELGTGQHGGVADTSLPAPDDNWSVVAPAAGTAYAVAAHPAWHPATADANWINKTPTYTSTGATSPFTTTLDLPDGTTVTVAPFSTATAYRTTFTLVPEVVNRLLDMEFAADNGATFYLNGHVIGGYDPPASASNATQVSAFKDLRPLQYAGPYLQDGLNTLTAVVTDRGGATGVLVRGGVVGCAVRGVEPTTCVSTRPSAAVPVTTYSPAPLDLGTGEQNGAPDPVGSVDTKWHTGLLGNAPAYSVAPYTPGWWPGSGSASWVSTTTTRRPGPGVYTYRVDFPVPADVAYGGLVLQLAADNDVVLRLNGQVVATVPGAFSAPHTVSLPSAPFAPGLVNTLEATVTDYGVVSGLYVEGGAYLCRGPVRVTPTS